MKIICPQCGAVIKTGVEHKVVKCPFCGTNLYFEKSQVLTKESIKPEIDEQLAKNLIYNEIGKELKVQFEYFPFYRIQKNNKTFFLPGWESNLIGINRYTPQGDRVTLEAEVPPPDFSIEEILEKVESKEEKKSIGLIYAPFFKAKDKYALYYIDAVKGKIFSDQIIEKEKHARNHYPFALFSFIIVTLVALIVPFLPFKIISVVSITFLLWYYDQKRQNG